MATIFCALACSQFAFADDGIFYASGNTLIPLRSTKISLKKEVLKLTKDSCFLDVDVYFEFNNPGKPRKQIVGFVTPPAQDDGIDTGEGEEWASHPEIYDFTVVVNDSTLPYKLQRVGKSGFRLPKHYRDASDAMDFIYYFNVKFRKGVNIVRHTYRFRAGNSVYNDQEYLYRLTTGKSWSNHEMEDFSLIIDLGSEAYFYVPQTFWKSGKDAKWDLHGQGKLSEPYHSAEGLVADSMVIRMVKIRNGNLEFDAKHFRPDYDLGFAMPSHYSPYMTDYWTPAGAPNAFSLVRRKLEEDRFFLYVDSSDLAKLSDHDLELLKNLPFAVHDCVFKSEDLRDLFSQMNWYMPNNDRYPIMKYLTQDEQAMVATIQAEEDRRAHK